MLMHSGVMIQIIGRMRGEEFCWVRGRYFKREKKGGDWDRTAIMCICIYVALVSRGECLYIWKEAKLIYTCMKHRINKIEENLNNCNVTFASPPSYRRQSHTTLKISKTRKKKKSLTPKGILTQK